MEAEHTSGIWQFTTFAEHHISGGQPAALYVEHDDDDVDVAIFEIVSNNYKDEQLANAAFIVKAANCHDDLVKACQEWMKMESEMPGNHPCPDSTMRAVYRRKAVELSKAAIKKAGGF